MPGVFLPGRLRPELEIGNPGLFFTLSTFGEIGIRLAASRFFDRLNKKAASGLTFWLWPWVPSSGPGGGGCGFFALGALLGLGWAW